MTNWDSITGGEMGPILRGIGLNLLVKDVPRSVDFLTRLFQAEVFQPTADFAIVKLCGQLFQLHADHTYHSNPLLSVLPESGPRGSGIEIRLYDSDPDYAHQKALEHDYHILQPPTDKATHNLRETYILDSDGYAWVPSQPISLNVNK